MKNRSFHKSIPLFKKIPKILKILIKTSTNNLTMYIGVIDMLVLFVNEFEGIMSFCFYEGKPLLECINAGVYRWDFAVKW